MNTDKRRWLVVAAGIVLMVMSWSSLAATESKLFAKAEAKRPEAKHTKRAH